MPFNARQNYNTRHDYNTVNAVGLGSSSSSNIVGGSSNNTVNGILRKVNGSSAGTSSLAGGTANANEIRHVDLLVFGYACKVFRDDAKARDIDQGKHLIPWMGDNNLKIDRYDVRGALYDLTPYEPPPGGYGNRLDYLTAEEQRAEQLCEEERYLFLYNNEEDVITKQEEEFKRLQQETKGSSYSQVGFSYDQTQQQIGPNREEFSNSPTCEEAEQVFQLPYNFQVPEGMQLPETMKQHAIIEKTARFIASQGVQMEILLKAKQSNNPQFEFLSQNSTLNPYYKYVINSIKDGTYPQHTETKDKDNKDNENANGNSQTATETIVQKPVVTVPTIKYKPSADCAYTQLISKIKGVPLSELHDESSRNSLTSQHESANNSPSLTPVLLQYNGATFVTEQDDNSNSNMASAAQSGTADSLNDSQPKVEILKNSSALALAQNYSSDSETEEETAKEEKHKTPPKLEFPLPPESLQNIIDKTAVYVIKNGRQFEETLRSKSVERFTFLLPDNEYYPYYLYKITGDPNAASKEQKKRKAKEVAEALLSKKGLSGDKTTTTAATNPVSFSIKTKDEATNNMPLAQPALPQEHSDEEDKPKANNSSSSYAQRHVPEHVQKAIQLVESQLMARNAQLAATLALRQPSMANSLAAANIKSIPIRYEADKLPNKLTNPTLTVASGSSSSTSKAEAERNAIFEQQQQQRHKELKKAEEKVKDKLAQIAREKLGGLISKEKQLQLERKRKAMAFLNQIKGVSKTDNNSDPDSPKKSKSNNEDDAGNNTDDSDVSVHSIPITSYGPNSDDEPEEKPEDKIIPTPTAPSPPHISLKTKELLQHKNASAPTVNVSDDDEVELISEIKPREISSKHRSRSKSKDILITSTQTRRHYRKRTPSSESALSTANEDDEEEDEVDEEDRDRERRSHRSKSKSHKSKKSKSKKSSKSKKKSKKRLRSKSRTRSRSRSRSHHRHHSDRHRHRSRSHSYAYEEDYHKQSRERERERERDRDSERDREYRHKRSSHTPSRSNYRSYSSSRSHKDKRHRYD